MVVTTGNAVLRPNRYFTIYIFCLQTAKGYLEQCIRMLRFESEESAEGKLRQRAQDDLETLNVFTSQLN